MAAAPRILVYAELLTNIRQVSVGCSLPSPCSPSTEASVSADGRKFTLRHEDEQCSVQLPGGVAPSPALPIQKTGSQSLSWRLPLFPAAGSKKALPQQEDAQTTPWSASDLQPEWAVKCRNCQAPIVSDGAIKVWKDLPSENWAEMMEFWHCHKPDDHSHNQAHGEDPEHLAGRGYGANSRISGQEGVGLVDLTSFLLSKRDCANITVSRIFSSQTAASTELALR